MQGTNHETKQQKEETVLAEASSGGNEQKRQALEITEEAREKAPLLPSFGSKLFIGEFDPSSLFPYPMQSEEDKKTGDEFIEKLTTLMKDHLDPDAVDATRTIPQEVIEGLGRLGAFSIKIPKEYGGLGFSQTNYNRAVMKVASYCGSTAVLLSAHQSIGVPQPLKMFGTEKQKQTYFPRFRKGAISAFALTEPDVGSDPAQMNTEAKLSEDGTHYILNGQKLWCTNGTIADVIIVIAKTEPKIIKGKERKQITSFILEMNTPGVEIVHRCEFMGLGGIYNGLLKFTNVKIPIENRLDAEGRGLAMALSTINVGRLTLPAACTGAAKQALSIARRWGSERIQWGMPIGLHEPGREKIAFIAATTFAMEAITWLTSSWADQGNVDIRIEAAMAKLFCTESLWKIVDMTMQLRGGRGYEKATSLKARGEPPYAVERMMRDCRINTILEGSSEIMRLFLAREAMDPHLKRAGNLLRRDSSLMQKIKTSLELIGHYSVWYPKQWFKSLSKGSFKELGELERHYQFIESHSHLLAREIFYYMARYRQHLEKKQRILGRLVEIGTELFVMAATCSYAVAVHREKPDDRSPIDLANYFCLMSRRRVDEYFKALTNNDDRACNQIAKRVIENEFKWLEKGIMWVGPET